MFNLFNSRNPEPMLPKELEEIESRWTVFLEKLEEKYREIIAAIALEAPQVYQDDTDPFKRAYIRFKSGMDGQLTHIIKKATETLECHITTIITGMIPVPWIPCAISFMPGANGASVPIINGKTGSNHYVSIRISEVEQLADADLEVKYQAILDEFEQTKKRFTCTQCGTPLVLDKIFFIATYITCTSCQTQNTFEPSPQAKMLQHIARPLAEYRTRAFVCHIPATYLPGRPS